MVMHSMVIILLIKTIQKKLKKKKKVFHWRCSAVSLFVFHFLMWSIAVPVASDVAQLACLLRCLPPEQYIVTIFKHKTQNSDIEVHESDGFIVLIKQIMYCSGHRFSCSPPLLMPPSPCWHFELQSHWKTTWLLFFLKTIICFSSWAMTQEWLA